MLGQQGSTAHEVGQVVVEQVESGAVGRMVEGAVALEYGQGLWGNEALLNEGTLAVATEQSSFE